MLCSTVLCVPHSLFPALIGINLYVGRRVLMMRSIPWSWISLLPAFLQGHVQLSHAVAAAVLPWNNYRLLFTCEWAVRVDCHVVISPSVVLRLCMYCEASCTTTSLCWWTKKELRYFKNPPRSCVSSSPQPPCQPGKINELLKRFCYLLQDWPWLYLQNMFYII